MAKDKLVLDEDRDGWAIVWLLAESGDTGAFLGEDEHDIASLAAKAAASPSTQGFSGYRWKSRADAQKALRAAKAALLEAHNKVPLPEWAKQALAAGWKMPKGWKP